MCNSALILTLFFFISVKVRRYIPPLLEYLPELVGTYLISVYFRELPVGLNLLVLYVVISTGKNHKMMLSLAFTPILLLNTVSDWGQRQENIFSRDAVGVVVPQKQTRTYALEA